MHGYAPYQYSQQIMVTKDKGRTRLLPPISLKEDTHGYEANHTWPAVVGRGKRKEDVVSLDVRHSLRGNSLDVTSVAVLVLPVLQKSSHVPETLCLDEVINPTHRRSLHTPEMRRVRAYLSYQGHEGGHLRQESGPLTGLIRPALQAIKADQWEWRTIRRAEGQLPEEHINTLETKETSSGRSGAAKPAADTAKPFFVSPTPKLA